MKHPSWNQSWDPAHLWWIINSDWESRSWEVARNSAASTCLVRKPQLWKPRCAVSPHASWPGVLSRLLRLRDPLLWGALLYITGCQAATPVLPHWMTVALPLSRDKQECIQTLPNVPCGENLPPAEENPSKIIRRRVGGNNNKMIRGHRTFGGRETQSLLPWQDGRIWDWEELAELHLALSGCTWSPPGQASFCLWASSLHLGDGALRVERLYRSRFICRSPKLQCPRAMAFGGGVLGK